MLVILIVIGLMYCFYQLLEFVQFSPYDISVNSISFKSKQLYSLNKKIAYVLKSYSSQFKFNVYQFIYISVLLLLYGCIVSFTFTKLILPSLIFGSLLALIPNLLIDCTAQYYNNQLSLDVSKFVSILTRWAVIKEDIYYCFEKSLTQIEHPLHGYISDFMMHVKYSGHIGYAFDVIIDQTYNEMLRNVMINLQQTTYSKGDLLELLERLEEEAYQIYGEHERRKTDTYFDKLAIYFSMVSVLFMSIMVLMINSQMQQFYLKTTTGNWLLSGFSILFFLGVYLSSKITSFNY